LLNDYTHVQNIWLSGLAQWAPFLPVHFSRGQSKVQNKTVSWFEHTTRDKVCSNTQS